MPSTALNEPRIERIPFGHLPDGREASLFTIINAHGLRATVCDFGALLIAMETPDRHGHLADLAHGFDSLEDYLINEPYFGASVGRFGNRIAGGKFVLDGKTHTLATNNAPAGIPCHLHGGIVGFNKHLWNAAITADGVEFTRCSPDGEEGYPGNLDVKITYRLTDDNELIWEAEAVTDAPTPVNLIHHSYWNLSGDPTRSVKDHILQLEADHYLPAAPSLIPTGELAAVAGTPLDFTTPVAIGTRIGTDFDMLAHGVGYDQAFVLQSQGGGVRQAARVVQPTSGRVMEIRTNQPAIHLYTANFIEGTIGKNGVVYADRSALCLETEAFPDAPNQPAFPSCILRPGEVYRHTLIHRFSID